MQIGRPRLVENAATMLSASRAVAIQNGIIAVAGDGGAAFVPPSLWPNQSTPRRHAEHRRLINESRRPRFGENVVDGVNSSPRVNLASYTATR